MITIYTDGSSIGNPGYGGRSAIVVEGDQLIAVMSDGYCDVTNNQMELMGAIKALEYCVDHHISTIKLVTDSQYVKYGIQLWIINRKRNGRRTASRKPVANQSLWIALDQLCSHIHIQRSWTKGHASDHWNNVADKEAQLKARATINQPLPLN